MSGSAKAGTTAERHECELRVLAGSVVRAPPKRASGDPCFLLTRDLHGAEKISRVAGRKINYVDLRPAEFRKAILSAGMPEWSADALVDFQRLYREGKASLLTDDVERLTGRKPITFDQFAHDYAFAFQTEV